MGKWNLAHIVMPKLMRLDQKRQGTMGSGLDLVVVINHCHTKNAMANGSEHASKVRTRGEDQQNPIEACCNPVARRTQVPRRKVEPKMSTRRMQPRKPFGVEPRLL